MNEVLNTLLTRRSVLAKEMVAPGPSTEQIDQILAAAHRVPDHGKIGPWRFIVFTGEAREQFSQVLGEIFAAENPDAAEAVTGFEKQRLTRAPVVIAVISAPNVEHKVPVWEQELSAGAACQNILLAASALGFGAQWLSEWYAYNDSVNQELELASTERVAGFIYIGSHDKAPKERIRPSLEERIQYWPNI